MAEPKMNELAQELLRRSRERKVPWEERTRGRGFERGGYQVIFPDGALLLTRTTHHREPTPGELLEYEDYYEYRLDLLSDAGSIIGSLTPEPDEPIGRALLELWDLAQNYIRERGIDKALDFLKSR